MTIDRLSSPVTGVWEVTTEHGTRIVLDPAEERWMRLPAVHEDGRVNASSLDGCWQRLLMVTAEGDPPSWAFGINVTVGRGMEVYTGMNESWRTTTVQAVRQMSEDEVPEG